MDPELGDWAREATQGPDSDRRSQPARPVALVDFLSLEPLDRDLFRGWCHAGAPMRVFGGQVAAQSLVAAGRIAPPGRRVNSLHGYFLRPGDPARPILYYVQRLRRGGTYASSRVTAVQAGKAIFVLSASFKSAEQDSIDRHPRMPEAAAPEDLPDLLDSWADLNPRASEEMEFLKVIQMRFVRPVPAAGQDPGRTEQLIWLRAAERLPDDPLLHACALTYASDLTLAATAALGIDEPFYHRRGPRQLFMSSLDHAVWFHRPFRSDQWLLFAQRSPSLGDGRGLSHGEFWSADGRLVASVVQETLIRTPRHEPATPGSDGVQPQQS
jgi:acyl-CoA thioesterase II